MHVLDFVSLVNIVFLEIIADYTLHGINQPMIYSVGQRSPIQNSSHIVNW